MTTRYFVCTWTRKGWKPLAGPFLTRARAESQCEKYDSPRVLTRTELSQLSDCEIEREIELDTELEELRRSAREQVMAFRAQW